VCWAYAVLVLLDAALLGWARWLVKTRHKRLEP